MSSRPEPVELRAPKGARLMEIDWSDGTTSSFRHVILRGFCPCAHCQGHHGPIVWVDGAERANLELTSIEAVGNYAVQLGWADGHSTGIFSFRYLRELAGLADVELEAAKAERFGR
jgi:DUF971 family protein